MKTIKIPTILALDDKLVGIFLTFKLFPTILISDDKLVGVWKCIFKELLKMP